MKIWYLYYNEDAAQIDCAEHSVKDMHGNLETPSNVDEFKCQYYTKEAHAIVAVKSCNKDLNSFTLLIHKCKDCGIYFFTTDKEEDWYRSRGMSVPKRCNKCRAKRRKSI